MATSLRGHSSRSQKLSARQRGLRRYGFHGLSCDSMSHVLPERHGDLARGRTIVALLGGGASLCAMKNLQSAPQRWAFLRSTA